jgi:hypothetical protein
MSAGLWWCSILAKVEGAAFQPNVEEWVLTNEFEVETSRTVIFCLLSWRGLSDTAAGKKSSPANTSEFNGHIPVDKNIHLTFFGVNVLGGDW